MPHKDPETKRAYHRDYMRRRRAVVNPDALPMLNPDQGQADPPRLIDWNRPYTEESRYPYPAYLVQKGYWFDPQTGELVGVTR